LQSNLSIVEKVYCACFVLKEAMHCFCLSVVFKVNKFKFGYIVFSLFGWICIISPRLFTYIFKDVKYYVVTNFGWHAEEFSHWFSRFRHANRRRLPAPAVDKLFLSLCLHGCERIMATRTEFHFGWWVCTFFVQRSSLRNWCTPTRETSCVPATPTQLCGLSFKQSLL